MQPRVVPLSAILPTRNRAVILSRFFDSLEQQDTLPAEMVICDASDGDDTQTAVAARAAAWQTKFDNRIHWIVMKANRTGLAPQRNQAVAAATQPYVWFLDDDMLLEPGCVQTLFDAIDPNPAIGGVTATLINEPYHPPGKATRALMRWFEDGRERESYASACIGPGRTFMHDPSPTGPALTEAGWLGGGCTIYRKAALPVPAVPVHFEGGAIGEDLAASLHVAKSWQIFHVRHARAIHDSQGGDHKRSASNRAEQGLRNRYYIMTRIMGKDSLRDHFDFALMYLFNLLSLITQRSQWADIVPNVTGWSRGVCKLLSA